MRGLERAVIVVTALAALSLTVVSAGLSRGTTAGRTTVTSGTSGLGRIVVDSRGRTLYLFEKDKRGASACSGACAAYWPPLLTKGKPIATAGVKGSLLGSIRRADGTRQVMADLASTWSGVSVESLRHNQGKAAALQRGFGLAIEGGAEVVVMMDADGQDDPDELPKLVSRNCGAFANC